MTESELLISGGQLIVLALQLVVLGCQAWFLRGTLSATKTSADATKVSAEAACKSANVAEKSVNQLERPYVLVANIEPHIREFIGGALLQPIVPHVDVDFCNYGRTPALLLEVRACLALMQTGEDIPLLSVFPLGNVIVIGPQARWNRICHYQGPTGVGIQAQIEREQLQLWLFLAVRYEDMLGKEHQTQMRFRYAPREDAFSMLTGDGYTVRT